MSNACPKWKRQPEDRPAQITEAALAVFSRKGYQAATMQEIAEAAGITKGTIYLYFSTKAELFVETIRSQFEEVTNLFPAIDYDPNEDPEEVTRRLGRAFLDLLMSPKVTQALPLVIGEYRNLPQLRELYLDEFVGKLDMNVAGLIELGKALGRVRDVDPVIAARLLLGMFFIFVLTQEVFDAKTRTPMDKDAIVETITRIYFRGVLTDEDSPCTDS